MKVALESVQQLYVVFVIENINLLIQEKTRKKKKKWGINDKLWWNFNYHRQTCIDGQDLQVAVLNSIQPCIQPSIHHLLLSQDGVTVAAGHAGYSRCPSPQQRLTAPTGGSWGVPRPDGIYNPSSGLPWGLLPVGWKTSKGRCPIDILMSCPNHLSWFL